MVRVLWAAVPLLLLASGAVAQTTPPSPAASDAERGQHLWMADGCFQCHGTVGQGGVGPRLAPGPIPAAAISAYIRNPANLMPPYTKSVLDDAGVADIHAYLASIAPPPKLADIKLLAR